MTQTYPLTITRKRGWYGTARALILCVKTPRGEMKLGKIKSGKTITLDIPEDASEIYGRMDWAKTESMALAFIEPGDRLLVKSVFTLNFAKAIGAMPLPFEFKHEPHARISSS